MQKQILIFMWGNKFKVFLKIACVTIWVSSLQIYN